MRPQKLPWRIHSALWAVSSSSSGNIFIGGYEWKMVSGYGVAKGLGFTPRVVHVTPAES